MTTPLCLAVALPCEATPWVEHFAMKPGPPGPFRYYIGDQAALVVTGIGSLACAAGTGYLAAKTGAARTCVWMNVGVAGHPRHRRGSIIRVDKSITDAAGPVFYPSLPVPTNLPGATCITVGRVETEYREDALFDMECAGFFSSASRFSFIDLVHAVKIVSDSPAESTADLDKHVISALISASVPTIVSDLLEPLLDAARELAEESQSLDISMFLDRWHFSATNERRLRSAVADFIAARDGQWPAIEDFAACGNAREVIKRMRERIDSRPPSWTGQA